MLGLIAVANIMIYLTDRPYGYRNHVVESGDVDHLASVAVVTLVDGRSFPLFAFLLGYGLVQLINRHQDRGAGRAEIRGLIIRRALIMIAIGAVHGIVLFPGDILGYYGVVTLIIFGLSRLRNSQLAIIAVGWLLPAAVITGLIYGSTQVSAGRAFLWSFELGSEPFGYALRALEWVLTPFALLPVITAALIGLVAARLRTLDQPDRHRRLLRLVALGGLGLAVAGGLPSGLAVAGWLTITPSDGLVLAAVHAVTGVAGGLGYAALFGLLALALSRRRSRLSAGLIRVLTAAGRRSMSLYLSQSIVFVLLVSRRGLGWGADLGTAAAAGLALLVWAAGVALAAGLAAVGRPGPAEWLLRRLMYGRVGADGRSEVRH